jgi:two-component system, cell cycle response regulator
VPPATDLPQKRVLVVDDSKFVRTTFTTILRATFDVREAVDGEAAWQVIESDPAIVMVFTDLDMPKLNGFGLLGRIRGATDARVRDLPVIIISGNEEPGAKERARQAGAHDFIAKSAEAAEVLARLENVLRLVGTRRELEESRQAVEQKATHDPVTGTYTPHYLLLEGKKQYAHAKRHATDLSVMALRIDTYAEIVAAAGKEIGDIVLARIAKVLTEKVRAEDSVARTAEATFMVLAAGTAAPQMLTLAQRLQRELDEAKIAYRGKQLRIGSRVGVSSLSLDAAGTIEDLFRLAAQRLQAAPSARAPSPAPPPAAPAGLAPEIERALAVLERADATRLGAGAKEVLRRLQAIAKMIQAKGG